MSCSISDALCVISEAMCSIFDGYYTKSGNCSIFFEEKGRHTLITRASHLKKREACL
jgi:hypothetical protein